MIFGIYIDRLRSRILFNSSKDNEWGEWVNLIRERGGGGEDEEKREVDEDDNDVDEDDGEGGE